MISKIFNDKIFVLINSKGAEIKSVKDNENTEYIWQGDDSIWKDSSPVLFPYIARLTDKKYIYKEEIYTMNIHGFAKDSEFLVCEKKDGFISFLLKSNDETKKQYPFDFDFYINYTLKENQLEIEYIVQNKDEKDMFFGLGGHTGYKLPLEENLEFEDYYLEFLNECKAVRVGFSEDNFVNNNDEKFDLIDNKKLNLEHSLFDKDAIVLKNMDKTIFLKSNKGKKGVKVEFFNMDYLGIWHRPKTTAPYVCIEPWTSLPSRKNVIEDIEKQDNLIKLKANDIYKNKCIVSFL